MRLCTLLVVVCLTFVSIDGQAAEQRAIEMTFLKAKPGHEDGLKRFIQRNWFAMDKVAVERGLMESYSIAASTDPDADWDFVVVVTYLDENGYEGIAEEFEKIRSAHKPIKVQGKLLKELGKIVRSWKLLEERASPEISPGA